MDGGLAFVVVAEFSQTTALLHKKGQHKQSDGQEARLWTFTSCQLSADPAQTGTGPSFSSWLLFLSSAAGMSRRASFHWP